MPISRARSRTATPSTPRAAKSRSAVSRITSRVGSGPAADPPAPTSRVFLPVAAVRTAMMLNEQMFVRSSTASKKAGEPSRTRRPASEHRRGVRGRRVDPDTGEGNTRESLTPRDGHAHHDEGAGHHSGRDPRTAGAPTQQRGGVRGRRQRRADQKGARAAGNANGAAASSSTCGARRPVRLTTDQIMALTRGEPRRRAMPILVDSNVLLDVLTEDPRWSVVVGGSAGRARRSGGAGDQPDHLRGSLDRLRTDRGPRRGASSVHVSPVGPPLRSGVLGGQMLSRLPQAGWSPTPRRCRTSTSVRTPASRA